MLRNDVKEKMMRMRREVLKNKEKCALNLKVSKGYVGFGRGEKKK